MSRSTRRTRALVSLTAVAGLGLAGAAVGSAPAQSAAPAGDCAVAFPVGDLAAGDAVTGLTVTRGTTPEGFTGEVLGVLDDGIGPDVDMIMVRLTSPEIDRVGIWQGMSGSPVYAADGRLIGAVSYGLAMGTSPVAGVTPFAVMDDHLADPPAKVAVDRAAARRIARGGDVSVARAAGGFAQLPMPLGVAGVGAARIAAAADRAGDRTWVPRSAYAVGRAGAADATADDIVAGGNLAASMSYGDVTMAGVGTATSVCGDRVVGFGHPLDYQGSTSMALHPADAIYIQEDLVAGFKVANLGAPVGTITDDRLAGITGTVGVLPDTRDITSTLTYDGRSRTGVSHVSLGTPDALASASFYELIANHQAVVDGPVRGTEDLAWTITGTADGQPFELTSDDLYTSASDLTWQLGFALGDTVYAIARIPGVTIDAVTTNGDLGDTASPYRVAKVETRVAGQWMEVSRRTGVPARSGGVLPVRVTLQHDDQATVVRTTLDVPTLKKRGRPMFLQVAGGSRVGGGRMPRTIDGIATWLEQRVRNDELLVSLTRRPQFGGAGAYDTIIVAGRRAAGDGTVQQVFGPYGAVVRGNVVAPVFGG
ncbi:hypothetical protein [Nocardioides aquiterrae]|uniref:Peptidase S55 domain-containing protein n=1 Tax=Nocardioides aquiterrae TaxID=203799 RepID=A0ABP4EYR9_9ACTN